MSSLTHVVCAIEDSIAQLIGAYMQFLSFQDCGCSPEYVLTIVTDGFLSARVLGIGQNLGMKCRIAKPVDPNRYLNKFLALNALSVHATVTAMLVDWDILGMGSGCLPASVGPGVAARLNPANLYAEETAESYSASLPRRPCKTPLQIPTSVNGGVLAGTSDALVRLANRARAVVREDPVAISMQAPWKQEQYAISIALRDVGLIPLGDEWNATPLSPVEPAAVRLWHYNDSVWWTRRLKSSLVSPLTVQQLLCSNLSDDSPLRARFLALYAKAIEQRPLRMFLRP